MSEFKYIMFKIGDFKTPVIFPDKLVHDDMAKALLPMLRRNFKTLPVSIVSAGMIGDLVVGGTYGESTTMLIRSDKDDTDVINTFPYCHGLS